MSRNGKDPRRMTASCVDDYHRVVPEKFVENNGIMWYRNLQTNVMYLSMESNRNLEVFIPDPEKISFPTRLGDKTFLDLLN